MRNAARDADKVFREAVLENDIARMAMPGSREAREKSIARLKVAADKLKVGGGRAEAAGLDVKTWQKAETAFRQMAADMGEGRALGFDKFELARHLERVRQQVTQGKTYKHVEVGGKWVPTPGEGGGTGATGGVDVSTALAESGKAQSALNAVHRAVASNVPQERLRETLQRFVSASADLQDANSRVVRAAEPVVAGVVREAKELVAAARAAEQKAPPGPERTAIGRAMTALSVAAEQAEGRMAEASARFVAQATRWRELRTRIEGGANLGQVAFGPAHVAGTSVPTLLRGTMELTERARKESAELKRLLKR